VAFFKNQKASPDSYREGLLLFYSNPKRMLTKKKEKKKAKLTGWLWDWRTFGSAAVCNT
jgi:hypothetical protein